MKKLLAALLVAAVPLTAGDFKSLKIGDAAPTFSLKNYDGKDYALPQLLKDNKLVVVMFIATRCPVSNAYDDRMQKLQESYAKKGVAIVGINSNIKELVSEIAEHSKSHGFTFPILKDENNKIADLYGAQVTPETYVIAPDGKIMYHGRIDDSRNAEKVQTQDLAVALDALLAGKAVSVAETKAFGCSIKRTVAD